MTKLELSDEQRRRLARVSGSEFTNIIDAQAAEIDRLHKELIDGDDADAAMRDRCAALTEQVAQLTAERDEARALVVRGEQLANKAADTIAKLREVVEWECGLKNAFRPYQERAVNAQSEVARLTEQVAQLTRELAESQVEASKTFVGRNNAAKVQELGYQVARLTEQVAKLTAERDVAKQDAEQWRYTQQTGAENRANKAEREVARLTEALAAAEQRDEARVAQVLEESTRAESAERDRDAANTLLREAKELLWHTPGGHQSLIDDIEAHLPNRIAEPKKDGEL